MPWIFQLVAPVGYKDQLHVELFRSLVKRARLITELCGE
jgi:hypothetical protein